MTDALPNAKTFDLAQILLGRSFPEVEVPFYLDDASALKKIRLEKMITRLTLLKRDEDAAKLADQVEELNESIKGSRHVAHLHGISNKARQDLLKKSNEKFPPERDFLGNEQPNGDRDELFSALLWHAMLEKIVNHEGSVQADFTFDQIETLRGYLPPTAVIAIQSGISELSNGAPSGFEDSAQDDDFLS